MTKIVSATALLTLFSYGSPAFAQEAARTDTQTAAPAPATTEPGTAQPTDDGRAERAPDLESAEAAPAVTPTNEPKPTKPAKTTKPSKKKAAKKADKGEAKPAETAPAAK